MGDMTSISVDKDTKRMLRIVEEQWMGSDKVRDNFAIRMLVMGKLAELRVYGRGNFRPLWQHDDELEEMMDAWEDIEELVEQREEEWRE